jgi:hypothetical protein
LNKPSLPFPLNTVPLCGLHKFNPGDFARHASSLIDKRRPLDYNQKK